MPRMLNCKSLLLPIAGALLYTAGCSQESQPPETATQPASQITSNALVALPPPTEEHGHMPGGHGGIIVSIGRDSYHAEAVFEAEGSLKLFTLGQDETKVIDVAKQTLTAYVKADGSERSTAVTLAPEPQLGDADGRTSQFVGTLPAEMEGQTLEVTIPSIRIGADRFRIAFTSAVSGHEDAGMPEKVADDEERELYLTSGGKYTEADIEANGRVTVSQKFKGFKAAHDLHPKPGDKICPVTLTKANPQCSWIIGGKSYEFCCPPCVDEFVKLAKQNPDGVSAPEDYVKR